jgi:hypothetical protein
LRSRRHVSGVAYCLSFLCSRGIGAARGLGCSSGSPSRSSATHSRGCSHAERDRLLRECGLNLEVSTEGLDVSTERG